MILNLFKATRPQTLIIGILPILITFQVLRLNFVLPLITLIQCLLGVICLQISSNLINDVVDGENGVDIHRKGSERMVASGKLSSSLLRKVAYLFLLFGFIASLPLMQENYFLIPLVFCSLIAAFSYTTKPLSLSYRGLGELTAFIFFGLVSTIGTTLAFSKPISSITLLLGSFFGLGAALILGFNNLRDLKTDKNTGKRTLAVRLGTSSFNYLLRILLILKIIVFSALTIELELSHYAFLAIVLPFTLLIKLFMSTEPHDQSHFKFSLISFIGCSLSLLFSMRVL